MKWLLKSKYLFDKLVFTFAAKNGELKNMKWNRTKSLFHIIIYIYFI